jgi:hypothetical protein
MTLLMWNHEPGGFVILTDTLDVRADTCEPVAFHTKVYPALERNLVIVGTGSGALVDRWRRWVSWQPPFDPQMLDTVATVKLQLLWAELCAEFPPTGTASTSTVYHFAIEDGLTVVYTYRSVNKFASERDDTPGYAIKPFLGQRGEHRTAEDLEQLRPINRFDDLSDMVELACRIRTDQETLPAAERVHIGGELYLTTITPGACQQQRVHIFEDRDEMGAQMLLNRGIDIAPGVHIPSTRTQNRSTPPRRSPPSLGQQPPTEREAWGKPKPGRKPDRRR